MGRKMTEQEKIQELEERIENLESDMKETVVWVERLMNDISEFNKDGYIS